MTCAYRREIHHAHVAIRDWLAGDSRADALDALMARFAEDFSMVTPHGVVLDKTALGELFRSKGGTRPGLRIEIDGESLLASAWMARPWPIGKSSPTRRVAASACPP